MKGAVPAAKVSDLEVKDPQTVKMDNNCEKQELTNISTIKCSSAVKSFLNKPK